MRRLLSVAALLVGSSLLVVAFSVPSAIGGGKAQRVLNLNIAATGISYLDPALSYDFIGWRIEAATCARLLSYPDKAGAPGARLVPEVAVAFPKISANGKTYTFRVRSDFRFSDGTRGDGQELQSGDRACARPEDAVARLVVRRRHRRRRCGAGGQGDDARGCLGRGKHPDRTSRQAAPISCRGSRCLFFCAVPEDFPIDPEGITPPGSGPYYVASFDGKKPILLKRNPYYGAADRSAGTRC